MESEKSPFFALEGTLPIGVFLVRRAKPASISAKGRAVRPVPASKQAAEQAAKPAGSADGRNGMQDLIGSR
ncbi:MAG: hypothetical protein B7Y12_21850 [Rhizobiales bacterium 24-66-13]|jgi:hypothetical protein|nr:MAG: hypothetical protein B7Y12_21850 [Rhizobiales bacterium 24-66-13]OZB03844.1 MAG: hypothetical protein B7X67_15915 [Rhizobiales bacterium 39-66-18]HQS07472.1 hypothetical protein [Xanthobacteraceae bacterium]HQS47007.1 hypothetical protein [Xanthobacteraceae bacterium]